MPNGDPASKRGPRGIEKGVLIIGGAATIIEDWDKNVLNNQSQSNAPQKIVQAGLSIKKYPNKKQEKIVLY